MVRLSISSVVVTAFGLFGFASSVQAAQPGWLTAPPEVPAAVAPMVPLPQLPDATPKVVPPPIVPMPPGAPGAEGTPPSVPVPVPQPTDPGIPPIPSVEDLLGLTGPNKPNKPKSAPSQSPSVAVKPTYVRMTHDFGSQKLANIMPLGMRAVDVKEVHGSTATVIAKFGPEITETYELSLSALGQCTEHRAKLNDNVGPGYQMVADLRHESTPDRPLGFEPVTILQKGSATQGEMWLVTNPDRSACVFWVWPEMLYPFMNPGRLSADLSKMDGEYGFCDLSACLNEAGQVIDKDAKRILAKLVSRSSKIAGCITVTLGKGESYSVPIASWEPAEAPTKEQKQVASTPAPAAAAPVASNSGFAVNQQVQWRGRIVFVSAVLPDGTLKIFDYSGPGNSRADYCNPYPASEFGATSNVASAQPQAQAQAAGMNCANGSCYQQQGGYQQGGVVCQNGSCYRVSGQQSSGCSTGNCSSQGQGVSYGQGSSGCSSSGCSQPSAGGGFHPLQNMQQGSGIFGRR